MWWLPEIARDGPKVYHVVREFSKVTKVLLGCDCMNTSPSYASSCPSDHRVYYAETKPAEK